jgi:acetate---CoA ligase (ADP-forming)
MRKRRDARVNSANDVPALHRPDARTLGQGGGQLLPFDATMRLLALAGIPTASYHLIDGGSPPVLPPFDGPFVLKLADLAHRTEHGAVRLDVAAEDLPQAVAELRDIAASQGLPSSIAVQPMVYGHGEAFIGLRGATELGPVVAFGLGGVFVEVLRRVGGRMAPMSDHDAAELLAEFDDLGVLQGFRGGRAWDRPALVEILMAAARLAAAGRHWIESIDVNPLIVTDTGLVAVDGACFVR